MQAGRATLHPLGGHRAGGERHARHGSARTPGRQAAWALAIAVGTLVCATPALSRAYCRLSTGNPLPGAGEVCVEEGELLRWRIPCIGHTLHEQTPALLTPEQTREIIAASFATWQAVSCEGADLPFELAQTDALSTCDMPGHDTDAGNVSVIAIYNDWADRELPVEAFGVTLVWHDPGSGEIFGADMLLNDETMGRLDDCPDTGCTRRRVDLRNVVTHEAGHFLGLSHSGIEDSTMHYRATPREVSKRALTVDDRDGLCSFYDPSPAPPICFDDDFEPSGGFDPQCVARTPNGSGTSCSCGLIGQPQRPGQRPGPPKGPLAAVFLVVAAALARRRRKRWVRDIPEADHAAPHKRQQGQ